MASEVAPWLEWLEPEKGNDQPVRIGPFSSYGNSIGCPKMDIKKKQVETHEKMRSKEHIYESFSIICSHHLKILWLSPKKMMFQFPM